ncbi:hypothetical protein [Bradyrhizobium glycinis]|uniref:hypothetical protein n=1 Tax=Bradyrhizobium glycinis TaxID=2751812 RepID=UPI0018D94BD7|nr:hypothetical protein [Bradyrhizobium glycinis]MBH5366955.1 hypothetical protein [Bradyrhizobium glycinis]
MASLSEHELAVRELLLRTRPDAAALSDATINDLVKGNNPTSGSGGPALELNLWPLVEEVVKWLPVVSAVVSVVSNTLNIKKALTPEKKPSVTEIADAVVERLVQENIVVTYDRAAIENAVKLALP